MSFMIKARQKMFVDIEFSIVLPYTALFINLYNDFPSLSPFFSVCILFYVLNLIYGFSHRD